jgi:hypothetical protein
MSLGKALPNDSELCHGYGKRETPGTGTARVQKEVSVSGKGCAHASLSTFPRTAIVGAMALSCFSTSGVLTSPA